MVQLFSYLEVNLLNSSD